MRRKLVPAFLLLCFSCAATAQQMRMIFVVRHAERASSAPDSPLSTDGQKRAECLAATLKDAAVQSIFVTNYIRTQQTAGPLARELKEKPQVVGADDVAMLTKKVLAARGNTLIVAHSDTIPSIVQKLGAGRVPAMGSAEYDRMMEIVIYGRRPPRLIMLRYCVCGKEAKSPTDAGPMIRK